MMATLNYFFYNFKNIIKLKMNLFNILFQLSIYCYLLINAEIDQSVNTPKNK